MTLLEAIGLLGGIAAAVVLYVAISRAGRRSAATSPAALWARSSIVAVLFASVVVVALPWAAHWLLPRPLPLSPLVRSLGGASVFLVGMGGWIACLDTFSRRGQGTPSPLDPPRRLVTDGLYGIVRHPMEVAEMVVIWGVALYLGSLGAVLYAVLAMGAFHLGVVFWEEPELRERFGESYDAYCREVPRWIPRFATRRTRKSTAQ